ncbi:MAG: hypothetical protein AB1817_12215, partial [Chloroflexota bacterium]
MQIKKIFGVAILFALGFLCLTALPVLACEPDGDNLANDLKDPRCRLVLPGNRAAQPARAVAGAPVTIASAGNPVVNSGPIDYALVPSCYLPDGSSSTNALGIGEACPPPFLPPRATKVPAPVATLTASAVVTKTQPKGDSPYTARTMTGEWETIQPGERIWYRIDNGNNFYLDVWMDTYGRPGVTFAVYSPEQLNNLSAATAPKGRSATVRTDTTHDWWWKGA